MAPVPAFAAPDLELRKSVSDATPGPGQPVEFKVSLGNVGADAAADVVVRDKLPPELAIPAGTAAFPSIGSYDPVAGTWTVGTLNAGASATLVIPAIVTAANPPACIVNVATTSDPGDTHRSNDRATAAVRRSVTDRCADLAVAFGAIGFPDCGTWRNLDFQVSVGNLGPEEARDVFVDLGQNPVLAPNLRFQDTRCSGTRCTIALLPAGATVSLRAVSDQFANSVQQSLTLTVSASSNDSDYDTSNNQARTTVVVPPFTACQGTFIAASCFIATAAYGSPLEPHVAALREFRDRYLQRNALGRAFIRFYYRHSPPLAAVIAAHPSLRLATRWVLTPLVLAIEYPLRTLAFVLLALLSVVGWRLHFRR
ncbi:MAG: DUF11 domain-containing protein [Gammaproteobacteria bacterium]|nr:DUF11 domain-containing protein [Gammaproteobacteria bacterium]